MPNPPPIGSPSVASPAPWLVRVTSVVGVALTLVLGVIFSALFLAAFAIIAVFGGGWLWWQRRKILRQMKEQMPPGQMHPQEGGTTVIEGSYRVVERDIPKAPR